MRRRQQMQDGVGGTAHGDVQRHRVLERGEGRDRTRQDGEVVGFVVAAGDLDDLAAGFEEQFPPVGVGGDDGAVAGQAEAQRLHQAVHRVGGEHAGTRAAGRAGGSLHHRDFLVGVAAVGGGDHGVDQVHDRVLPLCSTLPASIGPPETKTVGNVEAHRGHQHARRDLVAVGDADHRVGAVRVDHVFDAVGDEFARGQAVQHAVVAHGDAVIDRDGVEFLGDAAGCLDFAGDQLAEVLEVHVTGDKLGKAVGDGDDRLAEVAVLHACRAPQAAGAGHVAAVGGGAGTVGRHGRVSLVSMRREGRRLGCLALSGRIGQPGGRPGSATPDGAHHRATPRPTAAHFPPPSDTPPAPRRSSRPPETSPDRLPTNPPASRLR